MFTWHLLKKKKKTQTGTNDIEELWDIWIAKCPLVSYSRPFPCTYIQLMLMISRSHSGLNFPKVIFQSFLRKERAQEKIALFQEAYSVRKISGRVYTFKESGIFSVILILHNLIMNEVKSR